MNELNNAIKKRGKILNSFKQPLKDKEMMLEAVDIIRTVSDHQSGLKRIIGRFLNRLNYYYYKTLR